MPADQLQQSEKNISWASVFDQWEKEIPRSCRASTNHSSTSSISCCGVGAARRIPVVQNVNLILLCAWMTLFVLPRGAAASRSLMRK